MGEFRFKQFSVKNEKSAMKVNTDGVLLGAWLPICGGEKRFLDIGTGTGVIALMVAQRVSEMDKRLQAANEFPNNIVIDAIDIDEVSVDEARANFEASPWGDVLRAECVSLQKLAERVVMSEAGQSQNFGLTDVLGGGGYDLIFSNPPYFINSLKAPEGRRAAARDNATLSHQEIIDCARKLLNPEGHLALILPTEEAEIFLKLAAKGNLYPNSICKVYTRQGLAPKRYMMDLSFRTDDDNAMFHGESAAISELCIHDETKSDYTEEYKSLTRNFYIKF